MKVQAHMALDVVVPFERRNGPNPPVVFYQTTDYAGVHYPSTEAIEWIRDRGIILVSPRESLQAEQWSYRMVDRSVVFSFGDPCLATLFKLTWL